jgi:hypothetical protein
MAVVAGARLAAVPSLALAASDSRALGYPSSNMGKRADPRKDFYRYAAGHWLLAAACVLGAAAPARAVPPPPPRAELSVDLVPNGPEQWVLDTVRAYQPVPVSLAAQAGDRLLLRLTDAERVLVLQLDTPSGLPWISGVLPGPDGIDIWFAQTGVHRLLVLMSAAAARTGRAANFELGLRLRR